MQPDKETGLLMNIVQDLEDKFAARTASDEAYKLLVMHMNAHALIEGDAEYAAFIDYANTEIEHFRQEVLDGKKNAAKTAEPSEK